MFGIDILLYIYGAFLLLGAWLGFKSGSKISMIMGCISGILIFAGLCLSKNNGTLGYGVTLAVSGILSIVFFMRLRKTQKFMPSGMLMAVSIVAFILSVIQVI